MTMVQTVSQDIYFNSLHIDQSLEVNALTKMSFHYTREIATLHID